MTATAPSPQVIIMERLERIDTNTQAIRGDVIRIQGDLTNVSKTASKLEIAVYGNGSPGLRETAALHEQRLECIELEVSKMDDLPGKFIGIEEALRELKDDHARIEEARAHAADELRHDNMSKAQDYRKFWYGIIAATVAAIVDVVLHLFKIF